MNSKEVKAVLIAYDDNCLSFDLIFDDGYIKQYNLDRYQIKSYRGARAVEIMEHCAKEYYELLGEPVDIVRFIIF